MFTPKSNRFNSMVILYHYGVYVIARLLADAEVALIAPWIEKAQAVLAAAWEAARGAYEEEEKARAVFDSATFHLLREVREFEVALLAAVRKQRDSDEYRRFFREGLTEFRDASLERKLRWVEAMVRHLAAGFGPVDPAGWAERLSARRKATALAQETWQGAVEAHEEARAEERRARDGWAEAYRATYGELTRRFPKDAERVESYFRSRPSRSEAEVEEPATEVKPETTS